VHTVFIYGFHLVVLGALFCLGVFSQDTFDLGFPTFTKGAVPKKLVLI